MSKTYYLMWISMNPGSLLYYLTKLMYCCLDLLLVRILDKGASLIKERTEAFRLVRAIVQHQCDLLPSSVVYCPP